MTTAHQPNPSTTPQGSEKAITLALSLAQAEKAIHEFTSGQVDGIVDADGRAYLLRPAQERLRENEHRLRAVLESTGDGITVVDRSGLIVFQNRAATWMLGYQQDELLGLSFFELVDGGELHQFQSAFFNVIEDFRADAMVEFHLRARDGSYLKVEALVSKLRDFATASVVLSCRDMFRRSRGGSADARILNQGANS